jgi:16S rRNA C967 or C1407 C5-methylase (RsmB/RsmF family)
MAVGPQTFGGMHGRVGYYLLDAASLCAPLLLNPQPGEKVLDVCAAPGGKSLVMSYLLFARDDIRPQATTLRDAIARQRQGGITGGEGAAQIARALASDGAAVEGEFDISDDEDEAVPALLPTDSEVDLFLSGGIDECKVARFLELMFDEGEAAECRVEEEILRGLTRGQSSTRVTLTTAQGDEQEADIEELINRDLENERAAQGVHVVQGRGAVPQGRRGDFLNAEYLERQEKHLREVLLRTTGKDTVSPDGDKVAKAPDAAPAPEPVADTPIPEAAAEEDKEDAASRASSGDSVRQLRRSKLVLNDVSRARAARLQQVMRDYLPMQLMPSVDVINSDASGAANFAFVTHTATGQRKIAASKRTSRASAEVPAGEFDCLLVDAPCSSDRHVLHAPEQLAHWTVQVTRVQAKRQIALLEAAVRSLKVGGRMVYSTCSLSPFENDGAVSTVVKRLGQDVVKVIKFKLEIGERTPMGWILLPDQPNCPWGPLYISYLQRVG